MGHFVNYYYYSIKGTLHEMSLQGLQMVITRHISLPALWLRSFFHIPHSERYHRLKG